MKDNQEAVSVNGCTLANTLDADMKEKNRRELMAIEAKKSEQDHHTKWVIRADVVYHFFAYRYFDRSTTCLDLLNFSDADIDSFNLTANKTRGLNNWHVCAEYLKRIPNATPETNTHRRRLIHKVRTFNKTQARHFRFYLQNLTEDDIVYIQTVCEQENMASNTESTKKMKLFWASSCVEDEDPLEVQGYNNVDAVDPVEAAIDKCLLDHSQKLREKPNQNATQKARDDAEKVEVHAETVEAFNQ